jgi:hypothetical protein
VSEIRAPFPWFGDAMAYAKAHVAAGVLRIDDEGRIWRTAEHRRGHWAQVPERRAENVGGKGYLRVSLHVPGHGLAIVMAHRLVYEVKRGPIPEGLEINHEDLNKQNNRPDNLEPVTGPQNIRHSYANGRTKPWSQATGWRGRARVTEEQKQRAREMRAAGAPLKRIAAELGIGISHAHRITAGGAP